MYETYNYSVTIAHFVKLRPYFYNIAKIHNSRLSSCLVINLCQWQIKGGRSSVYSCTSDMTFVCTMVAALRGLLYLFTDSFDPFPGLIVTCHCGHCVGSKYFIMHYRDFSNRPRNAIRLIDVNIGYLSFLSREAMLLSNHS